MAVLVDRVEGWRVGSSGRISMSGPERRVHNCSHREKKESGLFIKWGFAVCSHSFANAMHPTWFCFNRSGYVLLCSRAIPILFPTMSKAILTYLGCTVIQWAICPISTTVLQFIEGEAEKFWTPILKNDSKSGTRDSSFFLLEAV